MTYDEKLAVIAGNLRDAERMTRDSDAVGKGSVFELACVILSEGKADDAVNTARLVIPEGNRAMLAEFCRAYYRHSDDDLSPFPSPESAEMPRTVMIPEIERLHDVVMELKRCGMDFDEVYGDSFSACAEDVEYGHSRYVLMPMSDPAEGRLRSFDRLRERYGLKIHTVVNIHTGEDGVYSYQLCALGFPDPAANAVERISFTADTSVPPMDYLSGALRFGAALVSSEFKSSDANRIKAVLDTSALDKKELCGLVMYLGEDSHITFDGCYNVIEII